MITKTILGGWYSHCLPGGELASLTPWGVDTHLGRIPQAGGNDGPLFLDITTVGGFKILGKGANSFKSWERIGDEWFEREEAIGNYSVMYDLEGIPHFSKGGPVGSQGWRYVDQQTGRLVTGDETISSVDGLLNEVVRLPGGIEIGQGHDTGGVVVRIDGVLRQLAEGACYDIKARSFDFTVAISFYLVAPDGLSAHFWWGTHDDLRSLRRVTTPEPVPTPAPQPTPETHVPVITNVRFAKEIRPGSTWEVIADVDGTEVTVRIDEKSQLWLEAVRDGKKGVTTLVRQLEILPAIGEPAPVPTPPPAPEPVPVPVPVPTPTMRDDRFVLAPNIGSKDWLDIVDFDNIGVMQFYAQNILNDTPNSQIGQNTYPNIVADGILHDLTFHGIGIGVEMGSVKVEDPTAKNNTASLETIFQRINDAGARLTHIAMDEPLVSAHALRKSPGDVAPFISSFIARAKALDPRVKVVWIEAFPEVSVAEMQVALAAMPVKPDMLRIDLDWNRAKREGKPVPRFDIGLPLSVIVNSDVDPVNDDATHFSNLQRTTQNWFNIAPDAAQIVVQSWTFRSSGGTQDIPSNMGPFGLLTSFKSTRNVFLAAPAPVPVPVPQESTVPKSTVSEEVLAIKSVKPVAGTKLSTLILPDDTVYSCQADGSDGVRPAGTEGQWEKCRVNGNIATFKPTDKFFTKPFVEVDEL